MNPRDLLNSSTSSLTVRLFSFSTCFTIKVVFDNSDGRMTVDGDEVVLRRTVGLKKDEFFLNRKRVTKSEVSTTVSPNSLTRA